MKHLRLASLAVFVGCGTSSTPAPSAGIPDAEVETDATTNDGASACFPDGTAPNTGAPVGAACVPGTEEEPQFGGALAVEVSLDLANSECASGACVVNHFQGRVTCPYGQSANGQGPAGGPGCTAPGSCDPVTAQVSPQCADRSAAETVYCTCRCANADGQTDDGATYCTCPGAMTCGLVFESFGNPDSGSYLAGGTYCMKAGTGYDAGASACATCNPTTSPCP